MTEVTKVEPAGDELTDKQRELIVQLFECRSITAAAKAAGVGRRSYYRWLEVPTFRAEVARLRRMFFEEAIDLLNAAQSKAVATLIASMDSRSESIRLSAAKSALELGMDLREAAEMEERLAELESRAGLRRGEARPGVAFIMPRPDPPGEPK